MKLVKELYISRRFFVFISIIVILFVVSYFYTLLIFFVKIALFSSVFLLALDILLLYRISGISAERTAPERLSNGDNNSVNISILNYYIFSVKVVIIDELPFQFQRRDFSLNADIPSGKKKTLSYTLRPVERGEYSFGALNIFARTPLGLAIRRFRFSKSKVVPVYPSIVQMRKYDLFAVSNRLTEVGIKKIRSIGSSMEFDQIRKYVAGDDYRKINWKATARKSDVMVNQFRDERSQNVYSVLDMGRVMKMPFDSMTLLDYAINTSLVISNIAIRREDKAGIITFSDRIDAILAANRDYSQIFKILEMLYKIRTNFLESNYEELYAEISRKINQRSLMLLYTNFETISSLKRNLKFLSMIAKKHFLVIIFFVNTELKKFLSLPAQSIEKIYIKTIAEKFSFEKRQIIKELDRHGIQSILTSPENLTVNTINKYIELKSRGMI